jgi:UDP:flavonoid glycosyltransferase YjiC (YdhE family)
VPQADVLGHCAAAVHHAGAGTSFGVLAHGLPSVAVPQSADNFRIAALLDDAGAAHVVMPGDATAARVRAALEAVLADASYRSAADRIARDIATMPSAADVADALRQWAQVGDG